MCCSSSDLTDGDIIRAYFNGDESGLGLLYGRHEGHLFRCVRFQLYRLGCSTDDAKEVCNEAWATVFEKIKTGHYVDMNNFGSYLNGAGIHKCFEHRREYVIPPAVKFQEGTSSNEYDRLINDKLFATLEKLNSLPSDWDKERAALYMHAEGFSDDEIRNELGEKSSRTIRRWRQQIRKELLGENDE